MPARIRRILGWPETGKSVEVQVMLLPPVRERGAGDVVRVPAPSLIWVHGQQWSGDMMMDGVPGVRAVEGVRPLNLSGTSTQ
jgi:hypothetical protein